MQIGLISLPRYSVVPVGEITVYCAEDTPGATMVSRTICAASVSTVAAMPASVEVVGQPEATTAEKSRENCSSAAVFSASRMLRSASPAKLRKCRLSAPSTASQRVAVAASIEDPQAACASSSRSIPPLMSSTMS
jgi:hypothetical protein